MVLNVHKNHKAYQGRGGEGEGGGGRRRGKREIIHLSLHCHHQNDSCIKIGSDKSHFNVSLIVMDKVTPDLTTTNYPPFGPHPTTLPSSTLLRGPHQHDLGRGA